MAKRVVPEGPLDLAEVITLFPTLRQSLLSGFDDCNLSAFFDLEYARGWSTHPQARGTIFHRYAAECLREMKLTRMNSIPLTVSREILLEVCAQRGLPAKDIVRVPLAMMPELRMAADKWAKDNSFSIEKLTSIEERFKAPITYRDQNGQLITRILTGQIDAMLWEPPSTAVVLDWKDTWGLPPEPRDAPTGEYADEELKGLSYHGYFQQRFYAWLVMSNYVNVEKVTLREFYARKTVVRKATLHRWQLDHVEQELRILVEAFDRAVMQGSPMGILRGDGDGYVDMDELGFWSPSPGKHCGFCSRATMCPIEEDTRVGAGAAVSTEASAAKWAARMQQAERIRAMAIDACKGWVEGGGAPIPVKWSKGRRVLGWYKTKGGRRFGFYTPDLSDRGGHADYNERLKDAMRESTQRARLEREGAVLPAPGKA